MAIENLEETEHEEMVRYMKQAMVGTFFEKWLAMSGWMTDTAPPDDNKKHAASESPKHVIEQTQKNLTTNPPPKKLKPTGRLYRLHLLVVQVMQSQVKLNSRD
jgi:hypothetical protein